ncbi:ankyrin repeat domain-containing protein [Pontibacter sp. BAB1700]
MTFHSTRPVDVLFDAARRGDLTLLKQLIAEGVDVNEPGPRGFTPLIIATYNNQPEAARMLLEAGADVNAQDQAGNTALMGQCFNGYEGIAELLLEYGADLDVQNGSGGTA